jgi:hypothetical protein
LYPPSSVSTELPFPQAPERDLRAEVLVTAGTAACAKVVAAAAMASRGVLPGTWVTSLEFASRTLAFALVALLLLLSVRSVSALSRLRHKGRFVRGSAVVLSGGYLAVLSPALKMRLDSGTALAQAGLASAIVLIAGTVSLGRPSTRALGGVLWLTALSASFSAGAWIGAVTSLDRASLGLHHAARIASTSSLILALLALLVAAGWIATRSAWRGRILANAAIVGAFVLTWFAARSGDSPTAFEAMLRSALVRTIRSPSPYLVASVSAFVLPAGVLLALAALLVSVAPARSTSASLRTPSVGLVGPLLALLLLAGPGFDVPLHGLLAVTCALMALRLASDETDS